MIRPLNHAHRELFPLPDVDGNVAAVVHISAAEICARSQCAQNLFRYRSRNRRHWRNKRLSRIGHHRVKHSSRHNTGHARTVCARRLPQQRQFAAKLIENRHESLGGGFIGDSDLIGCPKGFDDNVNWPVVKMQPMAVRQERN
jgi:hypothetical protein